MGSAELVLPVVVEENACLPLSINVVAKYWNVDIPLPREAAKRYPDDSGSVLIEGMELAEAHGLAVAMAGADIAGLKRAVDAGVPPIVMLPGVGGLTQHLSVISGYDEGSILHYVPRATDEGVYEGAIPYPIFDGKWSQEGRVAIMVGPPDVVSGMETSRSLRLCMEAERDMLLKAHQRARALLERAISLDESNTTAWLLLASIQNAQNQKECVQSYTKCLELNGSCYLAHRGLGNHYLKLGYMARAERCYTSAIRVDQERSGSIYKNRAYVLEKRGMYARAARDLREYVRLTPEAPDQGAMRRAIRELEGM